MKKKRQIKVDDKLYWLHCYPTDSRSNYNHMVCVNEVGDLMPISGTTMKETDKLESFVDWAKQSIREYKDNKLKFV